MEPSLGIELNHRSGVPYYRQIIERILMAISDGRLLPGDRLPTVRQLAVDLQLNPNTVAKAYRDLEIAGVLETRPGSGTYVAAKRPREPELERRRRLDQLARELIAQAQSLGFSLEELIDTLKEHRQRTDARQPEPRNARRTRR